MIQVNDGCAAIDAILSGVVNTTDIRQLTKTGTGTLELSNNNTYRGVTAIQAGAINIQNGNALGNTTEGTTVSGGATLQLQNNITVGAEALTISGTGAAG